MMYEDLLNEIHINNIKLDENYNFKGNTKGLYVDGNIALSSVLKNTNEKNCILAEELGHYHTSSGNIIDQSNITNRKQEYRARHWAYNKLVGLYGIINAYKNGCHSLEDVADFLNVTSEFLDETLNCYKAKYGFSTTIDNYTIYFEPSVGVFESI